jgi:lipopolysaccharide export system protein LptA
MKNKLLFLIVVLMSYASGAWALKGDESQPIQIVADHLTVDQKTMTSTFTGNVVITQGSLTAHSNSATASQDPNGYKNIHLVGTPVTFSQMEDDGQMMNGQSNTFDYSSKSNLAVLTGRARINKGGNLVMGDKLTLDTKTQVYNAISNNANGVNNSKMGRVTVILQPEQKGKNGTSSSGAGF